MTLPHVFAFCLTYGRPAGVASVIQQWEAMEYAGRRELLILDDGGQLPELNGETWQVVSVCKRFASLGEKANAACSLAPSDADLLVVIEDDDYLAPWTLQAHASAFARSPFCVPRLFGIENKRGLRLHRQKRLQSAHAGWAFSRDLFRRVGGYPWLSVPHDSELHRRLTRHCEPADSTADHPPYLVHRIGVGGYQLSHLPEGDRWAESASLASLEPVETLPKPSTPDFSGWLREASGGR